MHALLRSPPYAPEGLHRKLCDEVQGLVGVDRAESIRLTCIRGHLSEELIIRHSRRSRQPEFGADTLTDLLGDLDGKRLSDLILRDIEEGFIQRDRLDLVRIVTEDSVNGARDLLIALKVRGHKRDMRTAPASLSPRHRRAYTEAPSLVARSTDHPSMLLPPDGDGDTTQLRMIMLLYRGIEGIHIDVYDLAHEGGRPK